MASFDKSLVSSPHSPTSLSSQSGYPFPRKTSSSTTSSQSSISPISPTVSPKVQLIPYARSASSQTSFSEDERELLDKASFDALDLSSQDFDFEDIFTYDKPQKKLAKVVEVSRPTRSHRDWSNFSFSHYPAAVHARAKVNAKVKPGAGHSSGTGISVGEAYVKNGMSARKG